MSYVVVIISFSLWTFEFQVTSEFVLRKVTLKNPELNIPDNETIKLLDQGNGNFYITQTASNYRTETPAKFYDTGWQSDHYEIDEIEMRPVLEGEWTCIDIIESHKSTDKTPFGIGLESKKITRICKIPSLENLIINEQYYKFFGFYRTDIESPFRGIVTKQWIEYPADGDISKHEVTISRLTEIKEVSGIPADIEEILKLPIEH